MIARSRMIIVKTATQPQGTPESPTAAAFEVLVEALACEALVEDC